MKPLNLLISTLLCAVVTTAFAAGTTASAPSKSAAAAAPVKAMATQEGSADMTTASQSDDKIDRLVGEKNYYAEQYKTIMKKNTAPMSTCMTDAANGAKSEISQRWTDINAELPKLLSACGYTNVKAKGTYGKASKKCFDKYVEEYDRAPFDVCSTLSDSMKSDDVSCFKVDKKIKVATPATPVDYVAKAKACVAPAAPAANTAKKPS